jgi:pSer/pThr/pTyr-binding forkhead associated (FHA) protein
VNCSRCGRVNPDGLKFCQDCGNRLNAPAAASLPAAPPQAPPQPSAAPRPAAPPLKFGAPDVAVPILGATALVEKRCVRCGTHNPAAGRFCANCGSPLPGDGPATAAPAPAPAAAPAAISCPRCRGSNAGHLAFCQYCGARLSDGAQPAPANPLAAAFGPAPGGPNPAGTGQGGQGGSPAASPFAPGAGTSFQFSGGERPLERAKLVVIGQDGKPGREYEIEADQTDIGREEGSILLVNDPYVSPRHARLQFRDGRFFIRDLESVNGVYVRLRAPERLQHADLVLVGLEVLRFEVVSDAERGLGPAAERGTQVFGSPAAPRYARLCQRTVEGVTRDVYYPTREETVIGREVGDVVFTTDPFMSRRHAAIVRDPGTSTFSLKDLGSSNGTYLGIRGERELVPGDHVRIGQHLFRLDFATGSKAR